MQRAGQPELRRDGRRHRRRRRRRSRGLSVLRDRRRLPRRLALRPARGRHLLRARLLEERVRGSEPHVRDDRRRRRPAAAALRARAGRVRRDDRSRGRVGLEQQRHDLLLEQRRLERGVRQPRRPRRLRALHELQDQRTALPGERLLRRLVVQRGHVEVPERACSGLVRLELVVVFVRLHVVLLELVVLQLELRRRRDRRRTAARSTSSPSRSWATRAPP